LLNKKEENNLRCSNKIENSDKNEVFTLIDFNLIKEEMNKFCLFLNEGAILVKERQMHPLEFAVLVFFFLVSK